MALRHTPAYIGMDEPLTPEFRALLIVVAERNLRVRREILLLAGHASGHLPGGKRPCRGCGSPWPCPSAFDAARAALEAFADV